MATVEETIITGRKYRIWDAVNSIWKRISYWTKASDVEFEDGMNLEDKVSTINTNMQDMGTTTNQEIGVAESDISWYGTCSTAAGTAAKVASTTDGKFVLTTGAKVRILFSANNTAANPTLNVDNKGAKAIKAYGTTNHSIQWVAGDVIDFTYNGTNWIMGVTNGQINQLIPKSTLTFTLSGSDLYITKTY